MRKPQPDPAADPSLSSPLDFFRPHKRVQFTGELINHVTGEVFIPERRTKQSHVAECDINNILKQYKATGQIAHIRDNAQKGVYADLPDDSDFQTALNIVMEGQTAFATLPSRVRERFGNDPGLFLEFMSDPTNQDEAIRLGLATKRVEAENLAATPQPGPQAPSTPPAPQKPSEGS